MIVYIYNIVWTYTTDSMDFVTVSTGLILPYWMGLPIRYIHFENVKFLQKVENVPVRRALVSAFIMVVSMGISFVGLTNVVKYGYGYCGYLGIAIIIVPLLTIGFYKNRKFMKENSQDTKVSFEEAYEKN